MTVGSIFFELVITLAQIVVLSMVAMVPVYISTLHQKLKRLNAENINLLDGMHEGLLILTKTTSSLSEAIKD